MAGTLASAFTANAVKSGGAVPKAGTMPSMNKGSPGLTAGNASGLNDGAAMLTIASEEYAAAHGLTPLAELVSYAAIGVDRVMS